MALIEQLGPLAGIWGSAVSAWSDPELRARPGGAVQYLWGAYNNAVGAGLLEPVEGAFLKMNALSSAAAKVAGASLNLMDAVRGVSGGGPDQAITAAHWAPDIDHSGLATTPFEGTARIRLLADVTAGGIASTQWFTWRPGLNMPQTVGAMLDAIDTVLQGFAEDYQINNAALGSTLSLTVA